MKLLGAHTGGIQGFIKSLNLSTRLFRLIEFIYFLKVGYWPNSILNLPRHEMKKNFICDEVSEHKKIRKNRFLNV